MRRNYQILGSGKLALGLILLLTLLCVAGAVLPQNGRIGEALMMLWRTRHPTVSAFASPLGLFDVFESPLFLATAFFLAINTLTGTILFLESHGGFRSLIGPLAARRVGFLLLHLSLLLLLAGAFLSMTTDLDGKIVLTEGQTFIDRPEQYGVLRMGKLRQKLHTEMDVRLESVDVQYARGDRRIAVASTLQFTHEGGENSRGVVEVNRPLERGGLTFTQDETGFSPRLRITHTLRKLSLGDTFIALDTVQEGHVREYADVVRLPLVKTPMKVVLYPSYAPRVGGGFVKTGETPREPMLELTVQDQQGRFSESHYVRLGQSVEAGPFTIEFTELREWASFRICDDPGYPFVCVALWIGLMAMLLRYSGDLRAWAAQWCTSSPTVTTVEAASDPMQHSSAAARDRGLSSA